MKINLKKISLLIATFCLVSSSLPLAAYMPVTNTTKIATDQAPSALGPYSQAVRAGSYVYVSGQIGVDPVSGQLAGESIEEQTKQVLKNFEAILATQGLGLENVIRTEVYLKNLSDFSGMNNVFAEKFTYDVKPTRATVEVSKLPREALVQISCIAFIPNGE